MTRFGRWPVWAVLIVLVPAMWVFGRAVAAEPAAKPYRPPPTLQAIVNRSTYIVVARPVRLIFVDETSGEKFSTAGANRFRALETVIDNWLYPGDRSGAVTVTISTQERFLSDREMIDSYVGRKLIFFLEFGAPVSSPRHRVDSFVTVLSSKAEPTERLPEVQSAIRTRIEKGW